MQGLFQFLTYATYFYYVRHEQTFLLVVTQGLHRDLHHLGNAPIFNFVFLLIIVRLICQLVQS